MPRHPIAQPIKVFRDFNSETSVVNNRISFTNAGTYYSETNEGLKQFLSLKQTPDGNKALSVKASLSGKNNVTIAISSTAGYAGYAFFVDTSQEGFEQAAIRFEALLTVSGVGYTNLSKDITGKSFGWIPEGGDYVEMPLVSPYDYGSRIGFSAAESRTRGWFVIPFELYEFRSSGFNLNLEECTEIVNLDLTLLYNSAYAGKNLEYQIDDIQLLTAAQLKAIQNNHIRPVHSDDFAVNSSRNPRQTFNMDYATGIPDISFTTGGTAHYFSGYVTEISGTTYTRHSAELANFLTMTPDIRASYDSNQDADNRALKVKINGRPGDCFLD